MHIDHALTRDEARERARVISGVSYEVTLDLTRGDETFSSFTRIRFTAEEGAQTFVDLLAAGVEAVTLNGRELASDAIEPGRIRLDGLADLNVLEVTARCSYERTGVGLHRFADPIDGNVYLYTQFEPFDAHRVYACFDQPDLKAPFDLTVRAPVGWEVVSNGEVVEREKAGDSAERWRFAATLPISPYITALVAGPYHVVRDAHAGIDLGAYCRASLAAHLDSDEILEVTKQGFDWFRDAFGYPYPFGKYDQLFVPEFNFGAMENAGCVTFSEAYIFRSKTTDAARQSRASTILHEMAHMWFGNLVTMRWWDDLWLNESFATYVGTRALAEATRFDTAWAAFANSTKAWAVDQDQLPSTHPISSDIVDTDAIRTNFDGITYAKGASSLKQLAAWVGDEAFFSGMRDYFERHEYGNATLSDFLTALEKASNRALGDWSAEWLETAGVATLRPVVEVDADGRYTAVTVGQEATAEHPTLRRHRVALGCYDHDGGILRRTRRVELDITGPSTSVVELVGQPQPDLLLVNDDDLAYAKVRLDDRSVATVVSRLSALEDALARGLCSSAVWDMTRDGELAARRWVELVAEHGPAETDLTLLQMLTGRAEAAANRYGAPENRSAARARLASAARGALAAAAPASDAQLAWVRHLVAVGDGESHRAWVHGLLTGDEEVAGLAVDTELRWRLLGRIAADGHADEERIATELERDPTDIGVRHAAATRASRPGAGSKTHAWEALTTDRSLPLATLRAMAGGFWHYGQEDVLRPYVDRYPEALQAFWNDRVLEEGIALTRAAYPSTIIEQAVIDMADALLDGDIPGPARRVVVESRDATQRAMRARAVDEAAS